MKEEKAKEIVEGLEMGINNGKMFRRYSKTDLIRFVDCSNYSQAFLRLTFTAC